MTRFIVYTDHETLLELEVGTGEAPSLPVQETTRLGFAVDGFQPGDEFRIFIGDQQLSEDIRPRKRRGDIDWETSPCLDGAHGVTPITLRSNANGAVLARVNALVEPSKLSAIAYERMFDAMTRITIELLLDLVTKSRLDLISAPSRPGQSLQAISARIELGRIKTFWRGYARLLALALDAPAVVMRRHRVVRRLVPGERLSNDAVRKLAMSGVSPRHLFREGVLLELPTLTSTTLIPENQILVGFVALLRCRLLHSRAAAKWEADSLRERINAYSVGDPNLLSFVRRRETPRLAKLLETVDQTDRIIAEMSRAIIQSGIPVPRRKRPSLSELDTPVFRSHPVYARAAKAMRTFLTQTAMIVVQGDAAGAKSIETIYEQWVYFETCKALRAAGLVSVSHKSIFEPISRNRFTVDLDRNAAVIFEAADGLRVSLRYEPIILPKQSAKGVDTLYRGNARTPWTPDLVLEIFTQKSGPRDYELIYSVVIDAKYTGRHNLERKLEEVARYQEIRSVATDRQIVRQVWVAAPVEPIIKPRDESIVWSDDGEVGADPSDIILGSVGLDPAQSEKTESTMRTLILGILAHARDFSRSETAA